MTGTFWAPDPGFPPLGAVCYRMADGTPYLVGSYVADGDHHDGGDDEGVRDTMGVPSTRELVRWWVGASEGCGRTLVRGYAPDADAAMSAVVAVADAMGLVGLDRGGDAVWGDVVISPATPPTP